MNKRSPSSRLVRTPAMSAGCSSTGPLEVRMRASISFAMIIARVVFPSPGGPESSTWSRVSPRCRAAVMNTSRFSLIFSCPTNSSSDCGRSSFSTSVSDGLAWGVRASERESLMGRNSAQCTENRGGTPSFKQAGRAGFHVQALCVVGRVSYKLKNFWRMSA